MKKITDIEIRHWIRQGQPLAKADGGGLTFTLSAKGTASWILRYRHGGRPRELTLGRYEDIGIFLSQHGKMISTLWNKLSAKSPPIVRLNKFDKKWLLLHGKSRVAARKSRKLFKQIL